LRSRRQAARQGIVMLTHNSPAITVSQHDHEALIGLALRALGSAPGATLLLQEMERARVVEKTPPDVLAMNGAVDFEYDGSLYRDFHLVFPHCADFADGRISVLTPVGAALIGLSQGQTMTWPGQRDERHRLTVLKVNHAPPH
jgi:regulator of nucleoside diphosphate kinase